MIDDYDEMRVKSKKIVACNTLTIASYTIITICE